MKNKIKILIISAIPFFGLAVFIFPPVSRADLSKIFINEVMIEGSSGEEFIELYNPTDSNYILKNHYLAYYSSGREWENPYRNKKFPDDAVIESRSYFLIAIKSDELGAFSPDWNLEYSSHQLSDSSGSIAFFPDNDFTESNALDIISWGEVDFVGKGKELTLFEPGKSFEKSGFLWQESYVLGGTPGKENSKKPADPSEENLEDYSGKIIINEFYPSPDTSEGEKEFVEIINLSAADVDLSGWHFEDGAKHKVSLPDKTLGEGEIFYLEGTFQLNNTSPDSVYLFDKNNAPVDYIAYADSRENYSYARNADLWQWTKIKTPGKINIFPEKSNLEVKIKKDGEIYKNLYANFEARSKNVVGKIRYTWNFGDGHKSYLEKTRHKYEKNGQYFGSLRVRAEEEDETFYFKITVKSYPQLKIRIKNINANPEGRDSDNEYITLENKSKKKINLKNWSVATGSKNLINHPISKDFIIKAGKTKKLTRKYSAFTLGNEKLKLELRRPDGKMAQKISYDRKGDQIKEEEIYEKNENGWQWTGIETSENEAPIDAEETQSKEEDKQSVEDSGENIDQEVDFGITKEEIEANLGKFSENPVFVSRKQNRVRLISYGTMVNTPASLLENQGKVAGAYIENKSIENSLLSKLADNLWLILNSKINWLLNIV